MDAELVRKILKICSLTKHRGCNDESYFGYVSS